MASWAYQSPSSTSSVQSSSKSSAMNIFSTSKKDAAILAENVCIPESLLEQKANGIMGVPISFLDKYCPEQFEIVALGNSRENFTPNKDYIHPRKRMKNGRVVNGGAINCVLAIEQDEEPKGIVYYTSDNSKYLVPPYARILIKFKEN